MRAREIALPRGAYCRWAAGGLLVAALSSAVLLGGVGQPGRISATTTTLSNTTSIYIPGRGQAAGTTISVPAGLGSLQELTVTINGLNHPEIYRIYDLAVTGPRGSVVHLMQQVGGSTLVNDMTLSFNDGGVPFGSSVVSGTTYRPTEGALTMFNGADPGGNWTLSVNVAIATSPGSIGGWSVTLKTENFPDTFTFTNDPITAGATVVSLAHLTELRSAVNALRVRHGLAAFSFTDAAPTVIRGVHVTELRSALGAVFTAMFRAGPTYTDATITGGATVVKATHFNELRAAVREADAMPLTITKAGSGSGSVTSSPPGIYCGSDCVDHYLPGVVVTLTPAAAAGSVFAGWSGACSGTGTCNVTMDAAKSATATFNVAPITLTIVKSGTGTGTVTSDPMGLNCGATCVQGFTSGTVVNLYVNPGAGSVFSGWSGGGCSGTGACQVKMAASISVTASFTATAPATYDVQPFDGDLGPWGGCNSYVIGQQFQVTAPPGTTWTVQWFGSDQGQPMHNGGVNKTSGSGNDTVVFTIDVALQTPAPTRTCANITKYYFVDYFTFKFYNSSGVHVHTEYPVVRWTYLMVN